MKVLAIVHVYYKDMWNELEECLRIISTMDELTIFITTCNEDEVFSARVKTIFPEATVQSVANKGYDLWPFMYVMNQVDPSDYDILVKLHTKRDISDGSRLKGAYVSGGRWRNLLLSFCSTPENWELTRKRFQDPKTGMVAHHQLCFKQNQDPCPEHYSKLPSLLSSMGLSWPRQGRYVAGSMFATRASLFNVFRVRFSEDEFPIPDKSHTEGLPHTLERLLGFAVSAQGYRVVSWDGKSIRFEELKDSILRIFFFRQISKSYIRYRIFGIPVWQKRR